MAAASRGQGRSVDVKFRGKVPLPLAMSLPNFAGITRIDLGKSVISDLETGRHFPGSRSFEVKFADRGAPYP